MSLFSDRLGQTRKQLGVKQQIIASELKITRPAYSAWENGRNEPSISMLSQLCRILNVSADYLLGLTDTLQPAVTKKEGTEDTIHFGSLLDAVIPRDLLSNLDEDLRDQANSYIAYLNEQQKQRDAADKKVKA